MTARQRQLGLALLIVGFALLCLCGALAG